jgi:diketogulonate reductase-like aldo/keto reductase
MDIPYINLDNKKIPIIGLGTWQLKGKECVNVVKEALNLGYRHIDTAFLYENHREIAQAKKHFLRKDIFLTTKFTVDQLEDNFSQNKMDAICHLALEELQTEYIDLFLVHWPDRKKPFLKIVEHMMNLKEKKMVSNIGVSNCTIHHLQNLIDRGFEISVNQVEFHPYLYQKDLLDFCQSKNIILESFRSLGKGSILNNSKVKEIAKTHRKSIAQILLKWCVQKNIPVIPKSSSSDHLLENVSIFDFTISSEEMDILDHLNQNKRFCVHPWSDYNY